MSWFVMLQHVLPKRALTQAMGAMARRQGGALTHAAIRWFVRRYAVNMSEAKDPTIESYASFNEFFTRELKADARPSATSSWLCPVDGTISQFGPIEKDQIFQAKGHHYSTTALLAGDADLAKTFADGYFATLYLSPRDYHRIHMPCDGELTDMIYVPGDLFSVNPVTAAGVPGLFARNERVVCVFNTPNGRMVLTLVGATIVGSMATIWHGMVNPPRSSTIQRWAYAAGEVSLKQGAEMGRFLLGSTVVMLFAKQAMAFDPSWVAAKPIRLNEAMANSSANG